MMKNFYNAVATAARADGTLTSLTGDASGDRHIVFKDQPQAAKDNMLVFFSRDSFPAIEDSVTLYHVSVVEFQAISSSRITMLNIADRLEAIAHQTISGSLSNKSFWSIDDSNIGNCMTTFRNRETEKREENTDKWTVSVIIEFWWFPK